MNNLNGWLSAIGLLCVVGCGSGSRSENSPGRPCTLIGCDFGALYSSPVSLGGADPATLEMRACINGSCDSQTLRAVTGSAKLFDCSGPKTAECEIYLDGEMAHLTIRTAIPRGVDPFVYLMDGDTYQITFEVPGMLPIFTLSASPGYKVVSPNGANCSPTCKYVTLTLSN